MSFLEGVERLLNEKLPISGIRRFRGPLGERIALGISRPMSNDEYDLLNSDWFQNKYHLRFHGTGFDHDNGEYFDLTTKPDWPVSEVDFELARKKIAAKLPKTC